MFSFRLWIFVLGITENDAEVKHIRTTETQTPSPPLPALHLPRTNWD